MNVDKVRIVILLEKLRSEMRGVALSALTRASRLQQEGYDVSVRTFDHVLDFKYIVKNVQESGVVSVDTPLLNIHDYLISNELPGLPSEQPSALEVLANGINDSPSAEVSYGPVVRSRSWDIEQLGMQYFEYYREDSSLYLRALAQERSLLHGAGALEWVNSNGETCARFDGAREMWAHWLRAGMRTDDYLVTISEATALTPSGQDTFSNICSSDFDINIRVAHGATIRSAHDTTAPTAVAGYGAETWLSGKRDALVFLTDLQRLEWEGLFPGQEMTVTIPHETRNRDSTLTTISAEPRIVTIASLFPLKRVDHVLRAFQIVLRQVPSCTLDIVGQGPLADSLQELAVDLGISSAVRFIGYSAKASSYCAGASLSLITSERETFSMPIIESMSYGTPVVAYDVAYGPKSLIKSGINGHLVKNGDYEALAATIVKILRENDPILRKNAWEYSHGFTSEKITQKWIDLIDQLVKAREHP